MEEYVQVQWCTTEDIESIHKSNVYLSDDPLLCSYNSRFSEDDDKWTSVPTQCPSKSVVTKKKLKEENAIPFECHNSIFVMSCPKPTCLTRALMHDFIPPDTTDKKGGRLLSPTARGDLPVRRPQHPWHREIVIHCNSTVMDMDRQLNSHHSRRADHQANSTNQFDSDLKPFEGGRQVDEIQTGVDIKEVETFKMEDDDGQVHTISVPVSIYVPLLKKMLLAPNHQATGMHKIGRAGLLNFDNCQESFKSKYKQRVKEIVADIKGASQQLWSKNEGDLDGDLSQCIWSSRMIENQHIQPNGKFVFQPLIKKMTRPSSSLRSTQEVIGAQVASPFLRELSNCSFWRSFTDSKHCAYFHDQQPSDLTKTLDNSSTTTKKVSSPILRNPLRTTYRSSETLAQIDKAREHETVYIMILTFPKFTSVRRNPSSPNVVQVSVDAFTSWYIQDLMIVKEDIEEYKFQIPSPMTIPWYAPLYFVNSISKVTCAQGKLRFFPLEPWIKPQTLQPRHYHRTHSSDIANTCVNSNPRCPSKGV
jgi:hypothetical protein